MKAIAQPGQRVWLDNLSRGLLASGAMAHLIEEDGLAGVTSNPTIFHEGFDNDPEYR